MPPPICLKKVTVHNLKGIDVTLPAGQLILFTGVSGSGKSSLAFDTIYAEGQRRYVESLPTHARQRLEPLPKPSAECITGLSPTIAIEQKRGGGGERSTVGTMTSIYDYMRVLFARVGRAYCPISKEPVSPQSPSQIVARIQAQAVGSQLILLCPYARGKRGAFAEEFAELLRQGFTRVRLDGEVVELPYSSPPIDAGVPHDLDLVIDRLTLCPDNQSRLVEAVTVALERGAGVLSVMNGSQQTEMLFSQHAFSAQSGCSYAPLEPSDFSFNHPAGMCPHCEGLGALDEFDLHRVIDPQRSIAQDCCALASSYQTVRWGNIYDNLAKTFGFSVHTPWSQLSEEAKKIFLHGTGDRWLRMRFVHPRKGSTWTEYVKYRGVLAEAKERYVLAKSERARAKLRQVMTHMLCPICQGSRLKPYPSEARLGGKRIFEVSALSAQEALAFFSALVLSEQEHAIAEALLEEIRMRLRFLCEVGLHYLALNRTAPTLSGGEAGRTLLASQLGSGLVGVTYVLDEPSVGLHPRDNRKLIDTLRRLQSRGNTVIVVEHDEEMIRSADQIVDLGPGAGQEGGHIVAQGDLQAIVDCPTSLTGGYLSRRLAIRVPKKRRTRSKTLLRIEGVEHHNLKRITATFPLGLLVAVTGVSGSGKSSLVTDVLYHALSKTGAEGLYTRLVGAEQIDRVICVDQSPIGRTPRSTLATYTQLFDEIRELFCQLPQSQAEGYRAGHFSFNLREGACAHCHGMGMCKIDMDWMQSAWVPCEQCDGQRFDAAILSVALRGKNIHQILQMSALEAREFFSPFPRIRERLETLVRIGLGYLSLGQSATTLSGGEAQRIKLAKELTSPSSGHTLYLLDEPTTGLHFDDVHKLTGLLNALVDKGNSVIVIEHNMELVKTADWVIDMGPEAAQEGGEIVAEGRPEALAKLTTPTGEALARSLHPRPVCVPARAPVSREVHALRVRGAAQNNLRGIDVEIPRSRITVCTGPSGAGKSSFAFETVYAEGQRRYVESLSPYARQFVRQCPRPKVESIEGLCASIAIEQRRHARSVRSTVGTLSETYDGLRLLYAHAGIAYCPETGEKIESISKQDVHSALLALPHGTHVRILAPLAQSRAESFERCTQRLQKSGYLRIRVGTTYYELDEEIPEMARRNQTLHLVIDRLVMQEGVAQRLYDAIDRATSLGKGCMVADVAGEDRLFNLSFAVPSTGRSYPLITPKTFSFNTQEGMCPECQGVGIQHGADLTRFEQLMELSALGLIYHLWGEHATPHATSLFMKVLEQGGIDPKAPLTSLTLAQRHLLFNGGSEGSLKSDEGYSVQWLGIQRALAQAAKSKSAALRDAVLPLLDPHPCMVCAGTRLGQLARHVRFAGLSIVDLCHLSIEQSLACLQKQEVPFFLQETMEQVLHRLRLLQQIGVGYLSLDRSSASLSSGELQRVHLSRQLGTQLSGCLYIIDEPSRGLHPHDIVPLHETLQGLRDLDNTLLIVAHDPRQLPIADWILDFGPGAGAKGGRITARGTVEQIREDPHSLTGAYLSGRKRIAIPTQRRPVGACLRVQGVSCHNLRQCSVEMPLHAFTCITGVSGSGKSTLLHDVVYKALHIAGTTRVGQVQIAGGVVHGLDLVDKVLALEPASGVGTLRADVSTYMDLLTPLRWFFSALPEAQTRGLTSRHFSCNQAQGMCRACFGLGTKRISLQFLPPVHMPCEACHGFRLSPLSLQVKSRGKHLGQVLAMSVEEVRTWASFLPKVVRLCDALLDVGLGYLKLDQEIATLAEGEAQRLRLGRELAKRPSGHILYLFDELSSGLHSEDMCTLLPLLHRLVDQGHTVVAIEHNLDFIANADWILDLGPGAGDQGGQIVATGTPESLAAHPSSFTGKYLAEYLRHIHEHPPRL